MLTSGAVVNLFLSVAAIDYEIDRDRITLGDILGEGQFGDVHRGIYHDVVSLLFVSLFVFLTVSHVESRKCCKSVVGAS